MSKKRGQVFIFLALPLWLAACTGAPLSTREKGTLAGGAIGAGTGAIIGSAVGAPGAGAAIGGAPGLGTGYVVGNALQNQETANDQNRAQLSRQEREIQQQRSEIRQLQQGSEAE